MTEMLESEEYRDLIIFLTACLCQGTGRHFVNPYDAWPRTDEEYDEYFMESLENYERGMR